jgi:GT2 family glycosyltransferase
MKAAVIVLNTNELEHLKTCLPSLMEQSYGDFDVIVADNGSTDGSVDYVKKNFHSVRIVSNRGNVGFAEGNNRGALAAMKDKPDFIVFLNPDTEVDRDWLSELVKAASREVIGGATSKALLFSDRRRLDSGGGAMNFLGYGWSLGYNEIDRGQFKQGKTPFVCGGYCLFKREVLERVGLFDGDYFIYGEDTDLSWRVRLAGYDLAFAPGSIVYHKYAPNFKKKKLYLLERNRIATLLKNYSARTLFILLPGILINEAAIILYSVSSRWFWEKMRSYLWNMMNLPGTMRKRRKIQRMRKVSDREITSLYMGALSFAGFRNVAVEKCLNPILSAFWKFACRLI